METIEQESESSFIYERIRKDTKLLLSHGYGDELILDKQGAKKLIKVLQEFVVEDEDKESEALRLNNLG